ncbi:hypothetical protein C4K68_13555 [Pokkaliibacter plantistimulans]|uniref:Bifunctional diguanylate cyclase/phosphodiesterase n=1 Tax=Proteobacteria bacterium 228 TaxID=2083153 RepID=A0A2S5KRG7_9PROT|nr:EAL domain-containing protein [Pokkaliibacter plantistimulans]PPC76856.1 hypothetical protein C4K68_13555 [Pokkaliibacter plantistimulans]
MTPTETSPPFYLDSDELVADGPTLLLSMLEMPYCSPVLITQPSRGFRIVYANAASLSFFGMNAEQISGDWFMREWSASQSRNDREKTLQELRHQYRAQFTIQHQYADGNSKPVEVTLFLFLHQGEEFIANYCVDISQRVAQQHSLLQIDAEAARGERDRQYQTIFERLDDAFMLLDITPQRQLQVRWLNPVAERHLAFHSQHAAGRLLRDLVPATFRDSWCLYEQRCLERGTPLHFEDALDENGLTRYIDVSMVPIRNELHEMVSVALIVRDITERKREEDERFDKERVFRALVDNAPDVIIRYDAQCRRIYVNRQYEKATRTQATNSLGRSPVQYSGLGSSAQQYQNTVQRVIDTGHAGTMDLSVADIDGQQRYYELRLVPEFDRYDQLCGVLVVGRDYTERHQAEERLHASEQAFRTLVENSPDAIVRYDTQCRRIYVNHVYEEICGLSNGAVLGKNPSELSAAGLNVAQLEQKLLAVIASKQPDNIDICLQGNDGRLRYFELKLTPELGQRGDTVSVLAVARDITERKDIEEQLYRSELTYRTLVENSPDIICRYNTQRRLVYCNPALLKLVNMQASDIIGLTAAEARLKILQSHGYTDVPRESKVDEAIGEVIATGKSTELETKILNSQGVQISTLLRLTAEYDRDNTLISVLAVARDISDIQEYQQRIHMLAFYDPLTALPNRSFFNDKVRRSLLNARLKGKRAGLMIIDLDHFKTVNDSLGHGHGDTLLKIISQRLQNCLDASATLARLGGDEFGVLLSKVEDRQDLHTQAHYAMAAIRDPLLVDGKEISVSASIGACIYPDDGDDLDDLVRFADSALYMAKASGRNTLRFYSKELTTQARERLELENDLRRCLERDEMRLLYQPKIDLRSGQILGAEALIRWHHPRRGLLTPDRFIHLAEDNGTIVDLGRWVIETACQAACRWNQRPGQPLKIAVNLSGRQFFESEQPLLAVIEQALLRHHCPALWLEVEITEGILLEDRPDVMDQLQQIRALGLTIAVDDFGTGYSSLGYLARFPIDTLKIDRSFVDKLTTARESAALVRAIISMARSLGMELVAEGVETEEQAIMLASMGCQQAQGYYYGKPMSEADFIHMLNDEASGGAMI